MRTPCVRTAQGLRELVSHSRGTGEGVASKSASPRFKGRSYRAATLVLKTWRGVQEGLQGLDSSFVPLLGPLVSSLKAPGSLAQQPPSQPECAAAGTLLSWPWVLSTPGGGKSCTNGPFPSAGNPQQTKGSPLGDQVHLTLLLSPFTPLYPNQVYTPLNTSRTISVSIIFQTFLVWINIYK